MSETSLDRARAGEVRARPVGGAAKRATDILIALAALLVLSPVLGAIALAVRLADPGPALYRHRRIGLGGRPFECLKFRSMVADGDAVLARVLASDPAAAAEWADTQKLRRDPRVTAVGRLLRRTSLDELPQLWNVLTGEMSIVGPRPIVDDERVRYGPALEAYVRARPGITGPWQIGGRNDVSYARRVALDRAYVENWSFLADLRIMIMTVPAVLRSRGCY